MTDCSILLNSVPGPVAGVQVPLLGELAFSLPRLILLIAWVYLCMYCVQRLQYTSLADGKYRVPASLAALVAGPLLLLVLFLSDTIRKNRHSPDRLTTVLVRQIQEIIANIRSHRAKTKHRDDSELRLLDTSGRSIDEVYGRTKEQKHDARILDLTESTIADALQRRASDILIDPKDETTYSIRLRIDGVLSTACELEADVCRAIINSIKAVSGMDIAERRRPQDGGFIARKGEAVASFRVASAGALNGEKLSIRVLNKDAGVLTLGTIGLSEKQCAAITEAIKKPSGMILICGPTGSGKTTTMYAMLNLIDRFTRNVITVEDPIEAILPQASQIEINPKADITFAGTLRSVLRQDPDVICVGEIRDEETAEIALRASQTGHLVLATLHCDSNATALVRLLDLGVSRLLLSSGLNLLLSQRLLRCLCKHCRKPARLSDSQIMTFEKKGFTVSEMFLPGQCRHCNQTGYVGRTAIADILVIDEKFKTEIVESDALLSRLRTEGNKKGRHSLSRRGIEKVVAGTTSLGELKRVVGS